MLRLLVFTEAWEGLLPAQSSHDEPAGVPCPEPLQPASQVRLQHACPTCCQTEQNGLQQHLCRVSLLHISLAQTRCVLRVCKFQADWSVNTSWGSDARLHRPWQHLRHSALLSSVKSRRPLQQMPAELLFRHRPLLLAHADPSLPAGCLVMADCSSFSVITCYGAEFLARAGCNPSCPA